MPKYNFETSLDPEFIATQFRSNKKGQRPGLGQVRLLSLLVGDLRIGGGTALIKKVQTGTVSINPGSIAAITRGSATGTITGLKAGDIVVANPPDALNTGLVYAGSQVLADNTLTVYLGNLTAGAIDDSARDWFYMWFDLT